MTNVTTINAPDLYQALQLTTKATPRPDLGPHVHQAQCPALDGFLLFQNLEFSPEQSIHFVSGDEIKKINAFIATG